MFKEMLRFKGELTLESIKKGFQETTSEEDFLGFEEFETEEEQQAYLEESIKDGFIEQDGDEVVIYMN